MKFIDKLLNFLYPKHYTCIVCNEEIANDLDICEHCLSTLPYMSGNLCLRCGQILHDESEFCDNCKTSRDPWYFDICRSVFVYEYPITRLVRSIKFDNAKYMFPVLSKLLTYLYEQNELACDVIVPVPLHEKRLKERKYNQAELLAHDLSQTYNIPLDTIHLIKSRDTKSQTRYQMKDRKSNVKEAFDITTRNIYKDKVVLIIDDVYTSGATINECAKVLKEKGGATQVIALTLAHTPPRDTSKKLK